MILGQPYVPPRDPHPDEPTARRDACPCGCLHLAPPGRKFVDVAHYRRWQRSPEGRAVMGAILRRVQHLGIAVRVRLTAAARHPCRCGCKETVPCHKEFVDSAHHYAWVRNGGLRARKRPDGTAGTAAERKAVCRRRRAERSRERLAEAARSL